MPFTRGHTVFAQCFTPCSAAAPGWRADVTQRRGSVSPRQAGLSTKTLHFGRMTLLVAMHVCLCKPHRVIFVKSLLECNIGTPINICVSLCSKFCWSQTTSLHTRHDRATLTIETVFETKQEDMGSSFLKHAHLCAEIVRMQTARWQSIKRVAVLMLDNQAHLSQTTSSTLVQYR